MAAAMSSYPSVEPDRVLVRRTTSVLVHLIVGLPGAHGVLRGQALGEDDVVEGVPLDGDGDALRARARLGAGPALVLQVVRSVYPRPPGRRQGLVRGEGEPLGQGEAARLESVRGMRARELAERGACALCPGMGHGVEQMRSYASPAGATSVLAVGPTARTDSSHS